LRFGSPLSESGIGANTTNPQSIAQTFTVGVAGALTKIRLPLYCPPGERPGNTIVLEIRRQSTDGRPTGALLQTTEIPTAPIRTTPRPTDLIDIALGASVPVAVGDALAFTLSSTTGANCAVTRAVAGQSYAAGNAFFKVAPDYPDWVLADHGGVLTFAAADEIFETVIDTGPGAASSSSDCMLPGPGGTPVPSNAPVCRCVNDEGLREFRCALLHPDFFAIRRFPWPIDLGASFPETWEVLPLTKLKGPLVLKFTGVGKPSDFNFTAPSRKTVQTRVRTLKAPGAPVLVEGGATLVYGQEQWRIDTAIPAEAFATKIPGVKKP
jgi:hypothetical protein